MTAAIQNIETPTGSVLAQLDYELSADCEPDTLHALLSTRSVAELVDLIMEIAEPMNEAELVSHEAGHAVLAHPLNQESRYAFTQQVRCWAIEADKESTKMTAAAILTDRSNPRRDREIKADAIVRATDPSRAVTNKYTDDERRQIIRASIQGKGDALNGHGIRDAKQISALPAAITAYQQAYTREKASQQDGEYHL